jgi:hypothetical protein
VFVSPGPLGVRPGLPGPCDLKPPAGVCDDHTVAAPAQRRALGVLFVVLAAVFAAIAAAAAAAGQWVVAVAAAALAVWMAGLALRSLRQ